MFWKKKIVYETRPVYSIRQELERLRPFVYPRQSEGAGTYTEADIQAAEERLGYQLPIPVRELYLVMGDIMCRRDVPDVREYFLPLDQLHWDGRYLLLYAGTSTNYGYGIDRKDPYVDVFQWKRVGLTPEGRPLPDTGKPSRSEVVPKSASRWGYTKLVYWDKFVYQKVLDIVYDGWFFRNIHAPFTYFWDAFILHFVLRRMADDADQLDQARMTEELDQCYLSSDLPRLPKALEDANKSIVPPFIPLSSHTELIQDSSRSVSPVRAYLNQEDNCLLLMSEATNHYFLLTRQPVPYSFAQEMEGKTGLLFYSRNGNGKDKVLTRHQEMREQGLFRPS